MKCGGSNCFKHLAPVVARKYNMLSWVLCLSSNKQALWLNERTHLQWSRSVCIKNKWIIFLWRHHIQKHDTLIQYNQ